MTFLHLLPDHLAWLVSAGVLLICIVLGREAFITPWLASGFAWLVVSHTTTSVIIQFSTIIAAFILTDATRAADDVVGQSIDAGQSLANDEEVREKLENVKKILNNTWWKPVFIGVGFVATVPPPPVFFSGVLGVFALLGLFFVSLQHHTTTDAELKRQYRAIIFQSCTLTVAIGLHGLTSSPNPLLVLTMIAGMSIPSTLFPPVRRSNTPELTEYRPVNNMWVVWTMLANLAMPGLTTSSAGMLFLRRSIWRPFALALITAYVEGWNLRMLGVGIDSSKTALADLLNRNLPNVLEGYQYKLMFVVGACVLVALCMCQSPVFNRIAPRRYNRACTIGVLLGQSVAATGVLWTGVFIIVGFINLFYFRAVCPENEDAKSFGFLTPTVLGIV